MKKIITIIIFLIFIIFYFFNFGEKRDVCAFEDSQCDFFINKASNVCQEKLTTKSNLEYTFLYNINNSIQYVLAEGDECYLIYDIIIDDFIEFSNESNSPYFDIDINVQLVYYPVFNYMYKVNDNYYMLNDNYLINYNDLLILRNQYNDLYNHILYNKSKHLDNLSKSSGIPSCAEVPYAYYFRNLKQNEGDNSGEFANSCSYVAIGMLLSYYDSILDDRIIDDIYDINSEENFIFYSAISSSFFDESPGIDNNFHSYIIDLGESGPYGIAVLPRISIQHMLELLEDYLDSRYVSSTAYVTNTNDYEDGEYSSYSEYVEDFCKESIYNGFPVIVNIYGFTTDYHFTDDLTFLTHDVVAYEYDLNGILANYGWHDKCYELCINYFYLYDAVYVDINRTHTHSNNYIWKNNGCTGNICVCGYKTCNHESNSYIEYNNMCHQIICNACGHISYEDHNFVAYGSDNICVDCGCIILGHLHNFTYTWISLTEHRTTCACGYDEIENHIVPNDPLLKADPNQKRCLLCGGLVSFSPIIHPKCFKAASKLNLEDYNSKEIYDLTSISIYK